MSAFFLFVVEHKIGLSVGVKHFLFMHLNNSIDTLIFLIINQSTSSMECENMCYTDKDHMETIAAVSVWSLILY